MPILTINVGNAKKAPKQRRKTVRAKAKKGINANPLHRLKDLTPTQQMKQELKQKGFDTKQISIRKRDAGYSVAYDVEIKSPYIDKDKVERIVNKHQYYDTDERTGEILAGGNTYVFTKYDYDAFNDVAKKYQPKAKQYIEKVNSIEEGYGVPLKENKNANLFKDGNKYMIFYKDEEGVQHHRDIYSEENLSKRLFQLEKFGKIVD